jgi:hypothetical protein
MARTYGNIVTAIWLDPEFCALSAGAQRTYFMLVTQPDIAACGTLALTRRRWSKTVAEHERPNFPAWLTELEHARYVLVDEDTEELLVRTFAKWDGGYKHSQRVQAVVATAESIRSPILRASIATELASLGVRTAIEVPPNSDPSATQEAPRSGRSVVTLGESGPHSTLLNLEPVPVPHLDLIDDKRPAKRPTAAPDTFEVTDELQRWAREKNIRVDLAEETQQWLDHHRSKGTTAKDWTASWRTWMRNTIRYNSKSLAVDSTPARTVTRW